MSRPDVIVIGAGFAGLSAAVRLVQAGARVLVVEERRRLGGRATAFADAQTGEIVDNGQHALFGCYRETFAFLRAIDAYQNVALDERLDIEVIDGDFVRSRLVTPQWAPPLHLVGGLLRWSALGLRDRAAALRMGLALRRLSRLDNGDSWARLSAKTAETWLIECGQTPRLRELLWEPLVVAALNQSPTTAAAAPFARVLTRMFNGTRSDAAIGLPRVPLDALYAEPARRWLEAHGSSIRSGTAATLVVEGGRAAGVNLRDQRVEAGAFVSSVPWFSFPALVQGISDLAPIADNAGRMAASPIVTVNLWYDRTVTDTALDRPAWPDVSMGVRQGADFPRNGFAPVACVERRRCRRRDDQRPADRAGARGGHRVVAFDPGRHGRSWHRRPREARDVLAGARPAASSRR